MWVYLATDLLFQNSRFRYTAYVRLIYVNIADRSQTSHSARPASVSLRLTAWNQRAIDSTKQDLQEWVGTLVFEDMIHSAALQHLNKSDRNALQVLNSSKVKIDLGELR